MSTTVSNCIHYNSLVETFQDDHPRSKVTITLREQNETKYPASFLSAIAFLRVLLLLSEPKKDTADISANSERIKIWDFFKAWNKCIVSFYPMRLIEFESHNGKRKAEILLKKVIFLLICFAQTLSSIFSLVFSDIHQEESHMERYMSLHMLMYWNRPRAFWCPIVKCPFKYAFKISLKKDHYLVKSESIKEFKIANSKVEGRAKIERTLYFRITYTNRE